MLCDGIPDGQRNDSLTRFVGLLLRHRIPVDPAAALVHLVNETRCRPPLARAEVDRIIDSVAPIEKRRRVRREEENR
jgi:hypothetical protein